MPEALHPAAPLLAGALVVSVLPRRVGGAVALAAAATAVALVARLPVGAEARVTALGLELVWLRSDALARVFALAFALLGALGALYGLETAGRRLHVAGLAATAAALGIVLAGDWVTLYVAWEGLAVASFVLVLDGGARARAPALRYLLVHAAGGALLLGGIAWHRAAGGDALVTALPPTGPGALVLVACCVNAAVTPLHAWLTDAYPESSPTGTVLLSAFATKAAVYALARAFAGVEALVWAGVTMALYGVVFAVLENDIRRLLAYHIVSQVGYMVTGVGLGTPLGVHGAAAHAFAHILYKGLLLMGAGAVVHATGRRKLTELGGLARAMPATLALYMVGAFAISGAPLLNGFVSKSLVVAAAEALHRPVVVALLQLAAVGTFLHTGLKLPYFTFGGPDRGLAPAPLPRSMLVAMALAAALCALTGTFPALLYALLPAPPGWEPYTAAHVLEALELLAGTALGFALLKAKLGGEPTVTRDADRLYRAVARWVLRGPAAGAARLADLLEARAAALVSAPVAARPSRAPSPVGYALLAAVGGLGLVLLAAALGRG